MNLQGAVGRVLGYADTAYADRLSPAKADANPWRSWCRINGIFFDDMNNLATTVSYRSSPDLQLRQPELVLPLGHWRENRPEELGQRLLLELQLVQKCKMALLESPILQ
jgi:hypothetical protein